MPVRSGVIISIDTGKRKSLPITTLAWEIQNYIIFYIEKKAQKLYKVV